MSSSAERQAAFRQRLKEKGIVPLTIFVPSRYAADFNEAARICRDNPAIGLGPMRHEATGKLVGRK